MKFYYYLRTFLFLMFFGSGTISTYAQMTYSDSVFFYSVFTLTKYSDDTLFPGNWYIHDSVQNVQSFFNNLDSSYVFSLSDLENQNTFIIDDSLTYDSLRNATYNLYPFIFNQSDPLISIGFQLNGKTSKTYSYFYPSLDTQQNCKTAFLVLPGNGENESTNIVQGIGYHNQNCSVVNHLKSVGDVYTYIKPNQDARAFYWNNLRLNDYLYFYLNITHKNYGINYLTEIIATIKYLKSHYSKVILLGCSEGGYAGLLASMFTEPDASIISAGYTIGFDTSIYSKNILRERFDSLVDKTSMNVVKHSIDSLQTSYLFTYGNYDYLTLMQLEHDSLYTQQYLNDTTKCSFYYNYNFHSFPDCNAIDSFVNTITPRALVRFKESDTTSADSTIALIKTCGKQLLKLEIRKDTTLYKTILNPSFQNYVTLKDSGMYYVRNILAIDSSYSICSDSIYFAPPPIVVAPNFINNIPLENDDIVVNNPVQNQLVIHINKSNLLTEYELFDIMGKKHMVFDSQKADIVISVNHIPAGIYFLKVSRNQETRSYKILKL